MDLGIEGKWALVCAASKGLGKGCATALVARGRQRRRSPRAAPRRWRRRRAELRALGRGEVRAVAGDITTAGRPRRGARRLPAGRHPGQQRRRPAAGRLPRLGPRRLDQGARRQHADADRADQGDRRRDGRARLRPRRQHHLGRGEGADRHRSACRTARAAASPASSPAWRAASIAGAQRHDQRPAAGRLRHRPAARDDAGRGRQEPARPIDGGRRCAQARRSRRSASAAPRSSARSARSSAACRPATSPGRTCCSTAARTRERSRA